MTTNTSVISSVVERSLNHVYIGYNIYAENKDAVMLLLYNPYTESYTYCMGEEVHKDQVDHHNNSERRRQFFKSFEAKSLKSRSFLTQVADDLTEAFSSTTFLFLNAIFFTAWIILNAGWIPQLPAFDPFPYGLLTMAVSLEAIFLSIFVLVSQNRSSYISSIREEVHLRVNLIAEEEITKVLEVLAEIRKEMGIKKHDEELEEMLRRIDTNYIERSILDQINRAKPSLGQELANKFPDILKTPITHLTHNGDSQKSTKN